MSRFGFGFAAGGIGGNDSFTKVLMHFDGTNGSQTFTDVNGAGLSNSWTFGNAATTLTTTNPKIGTACLSNNNGSGVISAAKTAYDPGSGAFTIDFWFNRNGGTGAQGLVSLGTNTTNATTYSYEVTTNNGASATIQPVFSNGSTPYFNSGATAISTGWHHLALVRSSNNILMFVDGVLDLTLPITGTIQASTGNLRVGSALSGSGGPMLIDEFRYSIGIARWTSNFTPFNQPYS